jgi:hypothetical protein
MVQVAAPPETSAYINQNSRRPIQTNSYVTRLGVKLERLRIGQNVGRFRERCGPRIQGYR